MSVVTRIFARDIAELARSRWLLALVFIAPVALMLLIGNLKVRDPVTRVALMVGESKESSRTPLLAMLSDLSSVEVIRWEGDVEGLRERALRDGVDLVIVWQGTELRFYSPLTNRYRRQFAQAVAQDVALSMLRHTRFEEQIASLGNLARQLRAIDVAPINRARAQAIERAEELEKRAREGAASNAATLQPWLLSSRQLAGAIDVAPIEKAKAAALEGIEDLMQKAKEDAVLPTPLLRAWLEGRLISYFPSASQADHSLVPAFVALIAAFLPFLLASGSLVREREAGTLETLIIVVRGSWVKLAVGKLLMPILVAMLATILLLVAARTAFGFGIKPGVGHALGVQLIAVLVSALLGLSISTLIRSARDAYTTSAVYLVGLILLTGMIYPIEQAARSVIAASCAFPLTFSGPPLEEWMLKGEAAVLERGQAIGLLLQLLAASCFCAFALKRLRERL